MSNNEQCNKESNVGSIISPLSSKRIRRAQIGAMDSGHDKMCDLDNHADTCVVSPNSALITTDYDVPVVISGYAER